MEGNRITDFAEFHNNKRVPFKKIERAGICAANHSKVGALNEEDQMTFEGKSKRGEL